MQILTIHRHIGGLESVIDYYEASDEIHRHIGGLENHPKPWKLACVIHRHIGGLEICGGKH